MLVEFCHTSSGASWIKCTTAEEIKKNETHDANWSEYKDEMYRMLHHMHARCGAHTIVCAYQTMTKKEMKNPLNNERKKRYNVFRIFFIFIRTRIWATVEEWMRWVPLASCCCSHRSLHAVGWASIWFRGRSRNRLVFVESNELFRRGEQTTMTNSAPSQHSLNRSYTHKWNRWQCKWKMVYCFRLKSA